MASSHLVTHAELALHRNVHFDHLDHAWRKLITSPELSDLFIAYGLQDTNLFPCCAFDIVQACAHPSRLCDRQVKQSVAGKLGQGLLGEAFALMDDNSARPLRTDIGCSALPGEETSDLFIALFLDNFDLVVEILFNPRHIVFFDSPGTFVLLSTPTREHP